VWLRSYSEEEVINYGVCQQLRVSVSYFYQFYVFHSIFDCMGRSQWPRGLRLGSSAARLLRFWVRIPPGHGCLSVVSVVCCQVEVSVTD
jgi:hypothetical protein